MSLRVAPKQQIPPADALDLNMPTAAALQLYPQNFHHAGKSLINRVVSFSKEAITYSWKSIKLGGILVLIFTPAFLPIAGAMASVGAKETKEGNCEGGNCLAPIPCNAVSQFPFHAGNSKNQGKSLQELAQELDESIEKESTIMSKLAAAMGGIEIYAGLPKIPTEKIELDRFGYPHLEEGAVTDLLMQGVDELQRPIIVFLFAVEDRHESTPQIGILFQRYSAQSERWNWMQSESWDFVSGGHVQTANIQQLARLWNGLPVSEQFRRSHSGNDYRQPC